MVAFTWGMIKACLNPLQDHNNPIFGRVKNLIYKLIIFVTFAHDSACTWAPPEFAYYYVSKVTLTPATSGCTYRVEWEIKVCLSPFQDDHHNPIAWHASITIYWIAISVAIAHDSACTWAPPGFAYYYVSKVALTLATPGCMHRWNGELKLASPLSTILVGKPISHGILDSVE